MAVNLEKKLPRYYFHVLIGNSITKDEEGIEFADLAEAIEDAVRSADNFIREAEDLDDAAAITVQIADEAGTVLWAAPLFRNSRH